jgi:hypothetical protein
MRTAPPVLHAGLGSSRLPVRFVLVGLGGGGESNLVRADWFVSSRPIEGTARRVIGGEDGP